MKYKYLVTWFWVPRDRFGNVYSYAVIADSRSGRKMYIDNICQSNLRGVLFELNGGEHKQNYWWTETSISWREYRRATATIPHMSNPAEEFRKLMKSRKKNLVK